MGPQERTIKVYLEMTKVVFIKELHGDFTSNNPGDRWRSHMYSHVFRRPLPSPAVRRKRNLEKNNAMVYTSQRLFRADRSLFCAIFVFEILYQEWFFKLPMPWIKNTGVWSMPVWNIHSTRRGSTWLKETPRPQTLIMVQSELKNYISKEHTTMTGFTRSYKQHHSKIVR